MKFSSVLAAVTVSLALALASCSSSTVIRSNVPGAQVYIDGAYVGTTPYTMSDTKIVGSRTRIRIEAPGYEPTHTSIERSEEFSVGACIGGAFLLVPYLWIMGYKPEHFYMLRPAAAQQHYPPQAPGAQAPIPYPAPAPR